MDTNALFLGCRTGDLAKVKYLVEIKEVEVNIRDKWDSTPLYYACLCGHAELVEYLLEAGARCEANTFDGERCLYGALTDEIRRVLLRRHAVTRQTIRRDVYQEFLRRLLEAHPFSDITFVVHGASFPVHRCVLAARSEYFCDMLDTKWRDRTTVTLTNDLVNPAAFASLLQFLYTGRLETAVADVDDCLRLANQCRLTDLRHQLEEHIARVDEFVSGKPGTRVTQLVLESDEALAELALDLAVMAEQAVPPALCSWAVGTELPLMPKVPPRYADVVFLVEEHRFPAHKVFFCGRSEYFRALLRDPFSESGCDAGVPLITLRGLTAPVFVSMVHFVYQNTATLTESTVLDVLSAADMCLLPGLKRLCGNFLVDLLDRENVLPVLKTARLFQLPKLEDACTQFIAENLDQVLDPLTDPLPGRPAASSPGRPSSGGTLLARSELAIRAKLRRLGSADSAQGAAPAPDRPRSLEEVVVQVDTVSVGRPPPSAAHRPAAPDSAAAARVTSANQLCELAAAAAGASCRPGLSATLPRAAPTPCFYVHPPPAPAGPEPLGGGSPVPRPPASSCGSSRPDTVGGLVCGVPEAEMRGMGVAVCALMLMMSGLAIVYGYFMGY
ncbi:ankyrin repeat and BTB/POZ domain-containing protein 1-like isoform X1 [Amphibalanus amphitrite]|uniref:ankyrin repeat and BTB/POZ domain-containing protein 1-like isoform X1 n=1 Tax=Amphibalanus amphitrite TaxID=1232801 RepID=UPI001C91C2C2|nr:ankyrin repeat and BTB/POZ domain-containing protein 1-like isoform X1 [Amphibalanus amphitrite]